LNSPGTSDCTGVGFFPAKQHFNWVTLTSMPPLVASTLHASQFLSRCHWIQTWTSQSPMRTKLNTIQDFTLILHSSPQEWWPW